MIGDEQDRMIRRVHKKVPAVSRVPVPVLRQIRHQPDRYALISFLKKESFLCLNYRLLYQRKPGCRIIDAALQKRHVDTVRHRNLQTDRHDLMPESRHRARV